MGCRMLRGLLGPWQPSSFRPNSLFLRSSFCVSKRRNIRVGGPLRLYILKGFGEATYLHSPSSTMLLLLLFVLLNFLQIWAHDLEVSRVLVIYTGGTIGMRPNQDFAYAPATEKGYLAKLIAEYPNLNDKSYVQEKYPNSKGIYSLPPVRGMEKRVVYSFEEYEDLIDSSDISYHHWIRIARDIRDNYDAYQGYVVLHGTDTMAYTASALSFMLENLGKPVVLTGSQIPASEVRSDGLENVIGALIIAGNLNIPEVCVLFNNKLLRGNRVTKMDNHGLDAFHSPNMAPLATLDISIKVNEEAIFRSGEIDQFRVQDELNSKVVVLHFHPLIPIEIIEAILREPVEGVVLHSYGAGNIPAGKKEILLAIKAAIGRGALVVNVSQCIKGCVAADYENGKALSDMGVIFAADMTIEAALTKLAYVLAKKELSPEQKAEMMSKNIAGEISVVSSAKLSEMNIFSKISKALMFDSTEPIRKVVMLGLINIAAAFDNLESMEKLLSGGGAAFMHSEDQDQLGRTPLHIAAAAGSLKVVQFLLQHGASVHIKDQNGETPLVSAIKSTKSKQKAEIIEKIYKAGGRVGMTDERIGFELCQVVGLQKNAKEINGLLGAWRAAHADLSSADYSGRTALHLAASKGLDTVCRFLIIHKVKLDAKDHFGRTPKDEALEGAKRSEGEEQQKVKFENIIKALEGEGILQLQRSRTLPSHPAGKPRSKEI